MMSLRAWAERRPGGKRENMMDYNMGWGTMETDKGKRKRKTEWNQGREDVLCDFRLKRTRGAKSRDKHEKGVGQKEKGRERGTEDERWEELFNCKSQLLPFLHHQLIRRDFHLELPYLLRVC